MRQQADLGGDPQQVQPQHAGRFVARLVQALGGRVDQDQARRGRGQEAAPGFGDADPERRALEQAHAQAPLERAHGLRQRRGAREASLKRLDTDYIDLLYLHAWDDTTPGDEVMRAFDDLVRAGKILYAGISDTPAWQVAPMQTLAQWRGWSPFIALQVEYSLVERTGEIGCSPVRLAIAWVLQRRQPAVMPIIGARTRPQLEENLAAMALVLPDRALARLDEISAIEPGFPHELLALPMIRRNLFGEHRVERGAMVD